MKLDTADLEFIRQMGIFLGIFVFVVFVLFACGVTYLYHMRNDIRTIRSLIAAFIQAKVVPDATVDKLSNLAQEASTNPPWWK